MKRRSELGFQILRAFLDASGSNVEPILVFGEIKHLGAGMFKRWM